MKTKNAMKKEAGLLTAIAELNQVKESKVSPAEKLISS